MAWFVNFFAELFNSFQKLVPFFVASKTCSYFTLWEDPVSFKNKIKLSIFAVYDLSMLFSDLHALQYYSVNILFYSTDKIGMSCICSL